MAKEVVLPPLDEEVRTDSEVFAAALADLRKVHLQTQEDHHDEWDWIDADYNCEVMRCCFENLEARVAEFEREKAEAVQAAKAEENAACAEIALTDYRMWIDTAKRFSGEERHLLRQRAGICLSQHGAILARLQPAPSAEAQS